MSWDAQEPPPDFAERVTALAVREQKVAMRRRIAIGAGALALAAAATIALVVTRRGDELARGEATASERRIEVAIAGGRAVAVLEPGARIAWRGTTIEQSAGDVFYRVEPGAPFEVQTPLATARVLGTCFRVSVDDNEEMKMKRRDFGAGALGAVAATLVVIGVYEGKVAVSHGGPAVTVGAGEQAVADAHGVRPGAAPVAARPSAGTPKDEAALRARLAALEDEKTTLERELKAANDAVGKSPFDLSADDWKKLAEQGAFKYQLPCYREGGFRPTPEQLVNLGLAAKDGEIIQAAYKRSNQRFATAMRTICAAPGQRPDDVDMGECMQSLFQGLYAKGTESARSVFTQIAEVRAGMRPEPKSEQLSPQHRMLLFFSSELGTFEGELAKTYGAEEAHRLAYADDLCFDANSLH